MGDLIDNGTETTYAVLHDLWETWSVNYESSGVQTSRTLTRFFSSTDRHAVFDDELHQIFLNRGEETFAWMIHQRNHKLQDFRHIADHHEVTLSL